MKPHKSSGKKLPPWLGKESKSEEKSESKKPSFGKKKY